MSLSSPGQELVGAVLNGRWRLVRWIGEGGMGSVFEADGLHGEGKRAIKLLHQEFVREEHILARFFAEAQTTRGFEHPNVARIIDWATAENGTPYLVMELLQGIPVSTYVDQGQALPTAQAVNIVYGLLQALGAAHKRGIVHRDIKPDNLFLVRDAAGSFQVKVLDFGIAKVMDLAGGMGKMTRTGVLLGTPGYMAPEQIKNSKGVDGRADLWSAGIIFYELLTAKSPFPADNEFARLTSVLSEEVKPIGESAPHLASWAPFFVRALAKDPAQRFQTAEEMAQAVLGSARAHSLRPVPTAPSVQPAQPPPPPPAYGAPSRQPAPMTPAPLGQAHPVLMATMDPPSSLAPMVGPPSENPVAAVSQRSVPPPPPFGLRSTSNAPATPPVASAAASVGPTHVSGQRPEGTPTVHEGTPTIGFIDASTQRRGVALWLVGVIAFVTFALGVALGVGVAPWLSIR